jgi:putative membrane protein
MKDHLNWKLMLMRVVVNGLAIALTAWLLPGMDVVVPKLLNFLLLGAVFGLLNAFVKPIIQFLTLSLLFVTYGLVIILINTVMLLILEFIFTDILLIENIWWAIAGGFLIGLLGIFLENLLGLTPPIIDTETPEAAPKAEAEMEIDRTEHLVSHVETVIDDKETSHETQN